MFSGAPVRSLDDIARLRRTGFDFGEWMLPLLRNYITSPPEVNRR